MDIRTKELIAGLPGGLKRVVGEIARDPQLNAGTTAMMERAADFSSPTAALLAGIAVDPGALAHFDDGLDAAWSKERLPGPNRAPREVVIGAGLHAAIYCAVRAAGGHPPPLVIEASERVGGAFAVSRSASFYLNSRNKPGLAAIPGQGGSLNVLPRALLQPADIGGDEYQTNAALAFVIRATLAATARVVVGCQVRSVTRRDPYGTGPYKILLDSGRAIIAERVIVATGLNVQDGLSEDTPLPVGPRIVSFAGLMTRMDETFPLRGMERVAVVGAGDSGKTAIEALIGQGPGRGSSVASLDWPRRIDWYGAQQLNREDFVACNRSRYRGIARDLPRTGTYAPFRVQPLPQRAEVVSSGLDLAYVNEVPYDHVVICTGYRAQPPLSSSPLENHTVGGRVVGRSDGRGLFAVGPSARVGLGGREQRAIGAAIPENATALFRYAERTAALAASLD